MSRFTRRLFLQRASLGVAAVGGVLALPHGANAAPRHATADAVPAQPATSLNMPSGQARAASAPVMAYVSDGSSGQMSLFVGTREIQIHDADLVRRLVQAGA
jgi:hypothetical protein